MSDEENAGGSLNDVLVAKGFSIAIIFGGSLLFGLLPAFRVFAAFPRFVLSLILSYGGGILIATSLVHILPEVSFYHFSAFLSKIRSFLLLDARSVFVGWVSKVFVSIRTRCVGGEEKMVKN